MSQIAIIVPVYKVEKYLNRCIDSILAQTFTDFELILVDDGSPDNCGIICDEYAKKDKRIAVIHQKNGGLSAARNAGIDWIFANTDSEWISFIDSDDWVHPRYLEAMIIAARQTGMNIVIGGHARTSGENPFVNETMLVGEVWNTEEYAFNNNNTNATVAWGKLYKKECFETIRYPIGKIHEDEFVTYLILFKFDKLAVIDQPIYAYYQNPDGIIGSRWSPEKMVFIEATYAQLSFFKEQGMDRMYKQKSHNLIFNLVKQIKESAYEKNYKRYNEELKHVLKKFLRDEREMFPLHENEWLYEIVYPKFMYLYWLVKSLISKI